MTTEEKQLLFKDLCARVPYGVQMQFSERFPEWFAKKHGEGTTVTSFTLDVSSIDFVMTNINNDVNDVKPYLRPIKFMTEEEKYEYDRLPHFGCGDLNQGLERLDFLYSHEFDVRGLIPMGLALEAPDNMYKTE